MSTSPYRFGQYIGTLSTGAVSELLVCADLLEKGYDVYRAVFQNARCDLIVRHRHGGPMLAIEVKSAKATLAGRPLHPKPGKRCVFDHLAAVLPDGTIIYAPDLAQSAAQQPAKSLASNRKNDD